MRVKSCFIRVGALTGVAVKKGSEYAYKTNNGPYQPWSTIDKAIYGASEFTQTNYVEKGQNTLYTLRYNINSYLQGRLEHEYAANIGMAYQESVHYAEAMQDMSTDTQMHFIIPIYE
jgi:bifunctional autolysin